MKSAGGFYYAFWIVTGTKVPGCYEKRAYFSTPPQQHQDCACLSGHFAPQLGIWGRKKRTHLQHFVMEQSWPIASEHAVCHGTWRANFVLGKQMHSGIYFPFVFHCPLPRLLKNRPFVIWSHPLSLNLNTRCFFSFRSAAFAPEAIALVNLYWVDW